MTLPSRYAPYQLKTGEPANAKPQKGLSNSEKPRAVKDSAALPKSAQRRILTKIEGLRHELAGDVKRLTNFTPEYRLRVGDYRVLFEVEGSTVVI